MARPSTQVTPTPLLAITLPPTSTRKPTTQTQGPRGSRTPKRIRSHCAGQVMLKSNSFIYFLTATKPPDSLSFGAILLHIDTLKPVYWVVFWHGLRLPSGGPVPLRTERSTRRRSGPGSGEGPDSAGRGPAPAAAPNRTPSRPRSPRSARAAAEKPDSRGEPLPPFRVARTGREAQRTGAKVPPATPTALLLVKDNDIVTAATDITNQTRMSLETKAKTNHAPVLPRQTAASRHQSAVPPGAPGARGPARLRWERGGPGQGAPGGGLGSRRQPQRQKQRRALLGPQAPAADAPPV